MKKRIIICGYPKSGSTWLTRLTAEIVGCPVIGFWCQPNNDELAIEGTERVSEYQCFKAHHSFEQLRRTLKIYGNGTEKLVYIYRDPRDVVVSASRFFKIKHRYNLLYRLLKTLPSGVGIYNRLFHSYSYKLKVLSRGLIEGTSEGSWLKTPWKTHVEGFLAENVFCLSYESLRQDPVANASDMCEFLSVNKSEASLKTIVHSQSFHVKKQQLQEEGEQSKASHLRMGEIGNWEKVLTLQHTNYIESHIGPFMNELGYHPGRSLK